MNFSSRYSLLIALVISLLIHAISLKIPTASSIKKQTQKPLYVEVLPQQPKRETFVPQQQKKQPQQTKRQGISEQSVKKEQAPKGSGNEDSSVVIAQAQPVRPKKQTQLQKKAPEITKRPLLQDRKMAEININTAKEQKKPLPTLEQLLNTTNTAAADVARTAQTKERPNIENGDKLLLNMRKDKLFSFFSRFKKGIYNVWNYPQESIAKRQQGLSLLKIVINRDGIVEDVDLIRGSGFERLDREAIAAIFKGQPYGALPPDYPDEQLTINAYFEYILGQSKPRIYRQ
ncbi:MAG: hypothetical protein B6I36_05670 [Desulfobacteraceae bacterium 4572_35.1]|nr:MAG: hypothetical protein B6I36_05670 [Desulfobacteraceae bacterium 4572_35.1]